MSKLYVEKHIIEQAASGNIPAFETIYKALGGFVYSLSLRILKNEEDAKEATQDVFIKMYKELPHFRFESSLKTWVYRMATNTALNHYKKRKRVSENDQSYKEGIVHPQYTAPTQGVSEDHQQRIAKMLDLLTDEQRECVVLRNIEGLSYQEIADTLNVNINTVRTRLRRARETLLAHKTEILSDEIL